MLDAKIIPDYNKSTEQVYTEMTLAYLNNNTNAVILTECQFHPGVFRPTWVPDWSTYDGDLSYWGVSYASGPIATRWCLPEAGVLRMAGVAAGVITELHSHSITRRLNNESLVPELCLLLRKIIFPGGDFADDRLRKALARTLCLDMFEDHIPGASLPTLSQCLSIVSQIIHGASTPSESLIEFETAAKRFCTRCRSALPGLLILVTEDGNIGLAPAATRVGDKICVLLGCDDPLILRSENEERYILVGQCYLSSAQFGECLLGNMPHGIRV